MKDETMDDSVRFCFEQKQIVDETGLCPAVQHLANGKEIDIIKMMVSVMLQNDNVAHTMLGAIALYLHDSDRTDIIDDIFAKKFTYQMLIADGKF